MNKLSLLSRAAAGAALLVILAPAQESSEPIGYTDTPILSGQKWHVHDINRPHPRMVTPGAQPGQPPSDAIVLFDGKDLSHWTGAHNSAPRWKVEHGYMEVAPGTGDLLTKEKFGDIQLHIEWATPAVVKGSSQSRGNSGVILMSHYEIQVLDSYNNITYADGQAAAIYGQWPPMVNASRPPGEWQSYDIVWDAPRFQGGKVLEPAYVTVFHNGVVVHHHQKIAGPVAHRAAPPYQPHGDEPLDLQDHDTPVRFRNIWIRKLTGYDQS